MTIANWTMLCPKMSETWTTAEPEPSLDFIQNTSHFEGPLSLKESTSFNFWSVDFKWYLNNWKHALILCSSTVRMRKREKYGDGAERLPQPVYANPFFLTLSHFTLTSCCSQQHPDCLLFFYSDSNHASHTFKTFKRHQW